MRPLMQVVQDVTSHLAVNYENYELLKEDHQLAIHEAEPVPPWYQLMFLRLDERGRWIQRGSTCLPAIQMPKTVARF
ncbi:uncharacterized protein EAE98_003750 [Botrytis deweyae]|uniref:Uncharacterized protein n=1 Tax=Botrytis deweyae TaxID=2478750 RepID=A0ABQ7IRK8_9HELO|nr:uncharacterized protein EAE98_003750 [Botrytis deweyae]KAF7932451.1 hypothetical protein EAE98_003750 [Botrytis deweyae]